MFSKGIDNLEQPPAVTSLDLDIPNASKMNTSRARVGYIFHNASAMMMAHVIVGPLLSPWAITKTQLKDQPKDQPVCRFRVPRNYILPPIPPYPEHKIVQTLSGLHRSS